MWILVSLVSSRLFNKYNYQYPALTYALTNPVRITIKNGNSLASYLKFLSDCTL